MSKTALFDNITHKITVMLSKSLPFDTRKEAMDTLSKIFYSNYKHHGQAYLERFNSPFSVHLPLQIKQFNHNQAYPAFFYYTQDLVLLIEQISLLFGEFLSILPAVNPIVCNQFTLACVIDEVHSTSNIEGIHSTHRELKDILDGSKQDVHFSSIIKEYDLLTSGNYPEFLSCEDVRNFYDEFAHVDAIAENPKNRLDGKVFRKETVDVQSPSGKTIHRGVEPEENIIQDMSDALAFLNSKDCPALVRIAVFHYLFVYIHPFYDGNGRTARFISSCGLAKHLHPLIALRLSVTIKNNKSKYYAMLKDTDAETNCGDITPFICGFLGFVAETIRDINRKLRRKIVQLERIRGKLSAMLPDDEDVQNIGWLMLQASAFYGRGVSMQELMAFSGKSRNTIKKKFQAVPVRAVYVPNTRKKFYKIDWKALR